MGKRVADGKRKAAVIAAADGTKTTSELARETGAGRGYVVNLVSALNLPIKNGSRGRKRRALPAPVAPEVVG